MQLTRRHFLMGSAAPLLAQRREGMPGHPNVLLIIADDLAAWMVGCYGNKEIRTPHIDEFARTGARFTNSFVCTPTGSASRATLFTGRVPSQHGIQDSLTETSVPASFANEVMISDLLANAGYACGYVGKWHMGGGARPGHGYQYTYTTPEGAETYTDPKMFLNGEAVQERGYLTDLMTRRALEFIDRQTAEKPFFLVASYLNPHTPYDGHPRKYYDLYANTRFETVGWERGAQNARQGKEMLQDPVANIRKCAASVTALDDQIPLITNKLMGKKLWENTIVVFTADNGFLLGQHGLWGNGLASEPVNMHDEAMKVPLIWSWPGRVPIEAERPELVSFYDFLPTLCDALDLSVPKGNLCGHSYYEMVTGRPRANRDWDNMVFGQLRNAEMVRDIRYKMVLRDKGKGPNELYRLKQDPHERENDYDNPRSQGTRARLLRELEDWRKRSA